MTISAGYADDTDPPNANSQAYVWKEVAKAQDSLVSKLGGSVRSQVSHTSLQLTLENEKVRKAIKEYMDKLSGIIQGKGDVLGLAFAINGEVNSIDTYATSELFRKLWPKLLRSCAIEAIIEQNDEKFDPPKIDDVVAIMEDAKKGKSSLKQLASHLRLETSDAPRSYRQRTFQIIRLPNASRTAKTVEVHQSVISK